MDTRRHPEAAAQRATSGLARRLARLAAPAGVAVLILAGCALGDDPDPLQPPAADPAAEPAQPPSPEPPAEAGPADSTDLAEGRRLFGQSCAWCHGQQGEGSQFGPSLEDAGAASADFWLSTGRMPLDDPQEEPVRGDTTLDEQEIDALVDYVASLGHGPPVPTVDVDSADVQLGRRLYLGSCAACHSSTTVGGALPNGDFAPSLEPSTPTQIAEAIRLGPGAMPPFPEHALSDDEVDAVAAYVLSLREPIDHGGNPLGGYGPAAEGVVAWFVGLALLVVVARLLGKRTR